MNRINATKILSATTFVLSLGLLSLPQTAKAASPAFEHVVSHHSFGETVTAIKKAGTMNKMMVVGAINQKNLLAMDGLRLKKAETPFISNPVWLKHFHQHRHFVAEMFNAHRSAKESSTQDRKAHRRGLLRVQAR